MFKKLLVASAILAASSSVALAGAAPYIGGSLGVQANTSTDANARVLPVTVFGGYGATVGQNIYLAGEIFGLPGSSSLNSNGLRTTYGYGASIIPGVMLSDHTMAYARGGVVRSQFTTANKIVTGGQLGLGLQTNVAQNWDLRGEYIYTAYRSVSSDIGKPRGDQVNFGLMYKFD